MAEKSSPLVPKLRFSEFTGAGKWADVPIEKLLTVRNEKCLPTDKIPLYSLTIEDGVTPKSERYWREFLVTDPGKKKYKLVKPKDIVFNPSNLRWGAINCSRLSHSVVVSPIYEVLYVTDSSATCFDFVVQALMRPEQITRFVEKGQGTLVERIAVKIEFFVETKLPIPKQYNEQQKIADCLGSLDDLIAAEGKKLEALRQHKKGLMQQLFPQPGETVPKLRFPEFRDKWRKMRLGSVVTEFRASSTVQDEYEVLTSARSGLMRQVEYYGAGRITGRNNVGFNIIPPDHLTYRSRSDDGRFFFNYNHLGITGIISVYYPVFHSTNGTSVFLAHLLNRFSSEIGKHSVGTSQRVLSISALLRFALPIPEAEEQKKIADCLNSLDDLIAAENQNIEALRQHKQGLMQQLFPSLEQG